MMWTTLKHDWAGFLHFVGGVIPSLDPGEAPAHSEGPRAFYGYVAQVGEMTVAEAEEILEALVLPSWFSESYATAAE